MTTYNEIVNILQKEKLINSFYRFQGSSSFEYYNIKKNCFDDIGSHYVYFSTTLLHHYYFSVKRIRQLINTTILNKTDYMISNKQLNIKDNFSKISNLVINSSNLKGLNSIELVVDSSYYKLLTENSVYNMNKDKEQKNLIERVDRRKYKGGYGVIDTWLDLLDDLTLFSVCNRITRDDVLKLLENMKMSKKLNSPYLIRNILDNKLKLYHISDNIYNDFHKYKIMNDLEILYDRKLYLENSSFANNPRKTIKDVLVNYQEKREKVLRLVLENYHKY